MTQMLTHSWSGVALLAQDVQRAREDAMYIWMALAVIAALAFLLVIIAMLLRKRFLNQELDRGEAGFTLADIRRMYRDGELTQEEFDQARAALIGRPVSQLKEIDARKAADRAATEAADVSPAAGSPEGDGHSGITPEMAADNSGSADDDSQPGSDTAATDESPRPHPRDDPDPPPKKNGD